jgi:hypothetical protein
MRTAATVIVRDHPRLVIFGAMAFAALWVLLLRHQPEDSSSGVVLWWTTLSAISIINMCGWRIAAVALARRKDSVQPSLYVWQRWQLALSAVYVFGCGFRSVLPRADVQRIGLYDSWASSVMVGRSVATLAELCFVAQWALLLHLVSKDAGSRFGMVVARLLVPLIVVAEVFSWYSVLTTSYLGNTVEESIWALSASLLLVSCAALLFRCSAERRPLLAGVLALGLAYVAFMVTVDIPMYLSRWLADEANGRAYLSLAQGVEDVWSRRCITFAWEEWRTEMPWMSLYFSVCVWCSIAMVHAPWFQRTLVCRSRPLSVQ